MKKIKKKDVKEQEKQRKKKKEKQIYFGETCLNVSVDRSVSD